MTFRPNKRFKKQYDRIFRKDPEAANLFLLMAELADEKGEVISNEEELALLMEARFNNPAEYALGGYFR